MHPLTGCHRAVASPLKPVRPSQESRTESEGLDPPSGHSVVTEPPLQRNSASTSGPTSPAVKTSSPCLPPRGADRAVGGIRTEVENSGRRARATHDSTPIPTIRPKSQQFVATATLPRRARQVPTVGCSGATQEPASSRATTCHPVVLGLDPAMASRRSRPARLTLSKRAPGLVCPRIAAICARPQTRRRPAFISRRNLSAAVKRRAQRGMRDSHPGIPSGEAGGADSRTLSAHTGELRVAPEMLVAELGKAGLAGRDPRP